MARAGGLKQAARSLHVSPPTLSAQIRALEDSLGAPLFAREGRQMVLNDTGRVVRRYEQPLRHCLTHLLLVIFQFPS